MANGDGAIGRLAGLKSLQGLSADLLAEFARLGRVDSFVRDDVVMREGEVVDRFNVILAGRLAAVRRDQEVNQLQRGDTFGQLSLLAGLPTYTTIRVRHDTQIFSVPRDLMLKALESCPAFASGIFQSTAARLNAIDHGAVEATPLVIAVHSAPEGVGKTRFAVNLAAAAAAETNRRILIVDVAAQRSRLKNWLNVDGLPLVRLKNVDILGHDLAAERGRRDPAGFEVLRIAHNPAAAEDADGVAPLLSGLSKTHDFIIVDLPPMMDETVWNFLRHADVRLILTSPAPQHLGQTRDLTVKLNGRTMVVVTRATAEDRRREPAIEAGLGKSVEEFLPETPESGGIACLEAPRSPYAQAVRRVARTLLGTRVGLALSSGVARGFAHVGVLEVLEEEGLAPDVIAGSSVGALIGGLWAMGLPAARIRKLALGLRRGHIFSLLDLALPPVRSLLGGRRLNAFIRKNFGTIGFEELAIPLRVTATDIDTAEEVVLSHGSVADAICASTAIPGILEPQTIAGRRLMDGAVLAPVPVAALKRLGISRIIAVNVIPDAESIRRYDGIKAAPHLGRLDRLLGLSAGHLPPILDIIMRSNLYTSGARAEELSRDASVVIQPLRPDLDWLAFDAARIFIETGREATKEKLDEIRRLREKSS